MADVPEYDLIVIGGGPAGYAGAIRAGQLGRKVACIEVERAGGTCLNWGCIPTKALLKSAELYLKLKHAEVFGLGAKDVTFDFPKVMERSRAVAGQMAKGVEFLFRKHKVDYFVGTGQVSAPGMVSITSGEHQGKFFRTKRILLATGCRMRRIPGLAYDGVRTLTSREALAAKALPPSVIIVGAGAIGVEFAYFYHAFGAKVTLVEMLPQILPVEDEEVAKALHRSFEKQGIAVHVGTRCENFKVGADGVSVDLVTGAPSAAEPRNSEPAPGGPKPGEPKATEAKGGETRVTVEAAVLLSAIGVVPNLDGALAANLSPELERGYLKVGEDYQTSIKGIYAAGDIIGPPWLAHVATFEAVSAVNGMFGRGTPHRVRRFPGCTYCQPQVASIGLTEKAARAQGLDVKVGKFPFAASGKAVASAESEGFVKVVADAKTGEIYGAHILGAEATEQIAEFGLAMDLEATVEDIHHTIHAHPTLSEAVMEAAAAVTGEAIHI